MNKVFIFLSILFFNMGSCTHNPSVKRIGVRIKQGTVIDFKKRIVDAELGGSNEDYVLKKKETCVLVYAQHAQVQPATLFINYGELGNTHVYVIEIYLDEKAPLHQVVYTID